MPWPGCIRGTGAMEKMKDAWNLEEELETVVLWRARPIEKLESSVKERERWASSTVASPKRVRSEGWKPLKRISDAEERTKKMKNKGKWRERLVIVLLWFLGAPLRFFPNIVRFQWSTKVGIEFNGDINPINNRKDSQRTAGKIE